MGECERACVVGIWEQGLARDSVVSDGEWHESFADHANGQ